jgi:hypothetical protein
LVQRNVVLKEPSVQGEAVCIVLVVRNTVCAARKMLLSTVFLEQSPLLLLHSEQTELSQQLHTEPVVALLVLLHSCSMNEYR